MGRPRKMVDINKKHFTRAQAETRRRSERAYKVGRTALEDFDSLIECGLTEAAIAEYKRIVSLADWLDDLDRNDLISYCICWDRARQIVMSADARREMIGQPRSDGTRRAVLNPLWQAWSECCKTMRAISGKLALTCVDRLKLAAPPVDEPENKFLLLLKKGKKK